MEIPSILKIRALRDSVRKLRKIIKVYEYEGQRFGPEKEYMAKGLMADLDSLMIDISTLIKAPARFIKKTTPTRVY